MSVHDFLNVRKLLICKTPAYLLSLYHQSLMPDICFPDLGADLFFIFFYFQGGLAKITHGQPIGRVLAVISSFLLNTSERALEIKFNQSSIIALFRPEF